MLESIQSSPLDVRGWVMGPCGHHRCGHVVRDTVLRTQLPVHVSDHDIQQVILAKNPEFTPNVL